MNDSRETGLSAAQVEAISFQALIDGDKTEHERLFWACSDADFLYLDMNGTALGLSGTVEDTYELEKQVFSLPEEELMRYDIDKISPN